MFQLDERVTSVEQLGVSTLDLAVVCNRVSDDDRSEKRSTCEVRTGGREGRRRRRGRLVVVIRRAKGKLFPNPIREQLYGSHAPLYGFKRVFALDGEAACEQV